jgi:hypothetical protein
MDRVRQPTAAMAPCVTQPTDSNAHHLVVAAKEWLSLGEDKQELKPIVETDARLGLS